MNIPASLLSENYKSKQEHDDKMILNENNTSIIQAWEVIPLKLCSQNTKADFFWVQVGLWISNYLATQSDISYLCKTLVHSEEQHEPTQHQVPAEAHWEKRRDADALPWPSALGWAVPTARRGRAAKCYTWHRAARSHTPLPARSRGHTTSPACNPETSTDADVQGLLAKILTAALGPGVIHQMFTCTDRCLCWSSWFNSHYIIYQATDVIIND